ncbi:MAG: nucleoside recognition protein [Bacteroidales bacterium]|nr:nucleoside recognition protein [Bacteroidales bacterium]
MKATKSDENKEMNFTEKLLGCLKKSLKPGMKTAIWFLKITIPISLLVTILDFFGIIEWIAGYLYPAFKLIGLPGKSGLVFITSILLNIYSAIAVIVSLEFNIREATILALMCLISHNLIAETIIQRKTGSSAFKMVVLRIITSILAAMFLNWALPAEFSQKINQQQQVVIMPGFADVMKTWLVNTAILSVKIIVLINLLMFVQKVLDEFNLIKFISKVVSPFLRIMGLPEKTAFLWIIANVLGLVYGGAILIEEVEQGKLMKKDADMLNHHIAISHSTLEDTLLFMAIGVPVFWILVPRIGFAMVAVWLNRFYMRIMNLTI